MDREIRSAIVAAQVYAVSQCHCSKVSEKIHENCVYVCL